MKYLKILIPVVIVLIIIAAAGTIKVITNSNLTPNKPTPTDPTQYDFEGCKVEVLEHGIFGGAVLGELNSEDTEYFVNIMKAMKLSVEPVENYIFADGESAEEYLITLNDGQKIYFGQGYGSAEGIDRACFVHINGKTYVIENPAMLNALYVIKERFHFYNVDNV